MIIFNWQKYVYFAVILNLNFVRMVIIDSFKNDPVHYSPVNLHNIWIITVSEGHTKIKANQTIIPTTDRRMLNILANSFSIRVRLYKGKEILLHLKLLCKFVMSVVMFIQLLYE